MHENNNSKLVRNVMRDLETGLLKCIAVEEQYFQLFLPI